MKRLEGARVHNLPPQPTPLIGRERELGRSAELVRSPQSTAAHPHRPAGHRQDPPGNKVAGELLDDFPDGVCFVPLAPISDPDLVVSAIAQALGLREAPNRHSA